MSEKPVIHYARVKAWIDQYGNSGIEDRRALDDFMTIETGEAVASLRNELIGVSRGNYSEETMDKLVGVKRKVLHGAYDAWAKLMLQWMANYKG